MRMLCIVGTRPNFIKMAALYSEMAKYSQIDPILLHTGQHFDTNMSKVFFEDLALPEPDINLNVAGGTLTWQTSQIMMKIESVIVDLSPDLVVVVGDVNSTLAAALVAVQNNKPVAHVEAGLRSRDRTMPEEINRIMVDHLSEYLFVTEQSGLDNLKDEGIPENKVFFVGNVMIDTLKKNLPKTDKSQILNHFELTANNYALVTLHRPANSDNETVLKNMMKGLSEISQDIKVVMPVHPRTRKQLDNFGLLNQLKGENNLLLVEPLGYLDFLHLMKNSRLVLTDSGGIQEETTYLGIPCLTLRNNTERPVTQEIGTNKLIGVNGGNLLTEYYSIIEENKTNHSIPPLWDGKSAERIVNIIIKLHSR